LFVELELIFCQKSPTFRSILLLVWMQFIGRLITLKGSSQSRLLVTIWK